MSPRIVSGGMWIGGMLMLAAACASAAGAQAIVPVPDAPVRMIGEGVVSTPHNEFGGVMTPDGRELYYSISVPRSYTYAIVVSRWMDGAWTEPEVVPFSGVTRDFDPVLSPDGRRMFFISDRAPEGGVADLPDADLWVVDRTESGEWGTPRRMEEPLNAPNGGEAKEWFASVTADGTLYMAGARAGMPGVDLFVARRVDGRYPRLEPLGAPLETPGLEGEPMIAPDGSFLVFAAYERPGGYGHFDLYISHRTPGGWSEPVNLGPAVNTAARDYSPRLAPDGHTLLFTSERHFGLAPRERPLTYAELQAGLRGTLNGNGNLYAVDLRALGVLPPAAP